MNDETNDVDELLALGAAGALTEAEQRRLEELIAGDPSLAERYRELREAVTTLADASREPPPAALRATVLAAIEEPPAGGTEVHALPARQVRHHRWMIPATVAAALVALLAAGLLIDRAADAPTSDERAAAALADPDAITIDLQSSIGSLQLVKSAAENTTLLMGDDVEAPVSGNQFQLWAIDDGEMQSMGVFMPSDDGEVMMVMDGVSPPETGYAVTVEPMGGSDQPTGDHVAET